MAKKQNKTFAQRAKDLIKKYPRAEFDQVEKQELDAAMDALQQEQEAVKASMEKPKDKIFDDGGGLDFYEEDLMRRNIEGNAPLAMDQYKNTSFISPETAKEIPIDKYGGKSPLDAYLEKQSGTAITKETPKKSTYNPYTPYATSITPAIVGGAVSALGNFTLAGGSNYDEKRDNIKLPRINAEKVNFAPERELIRREGIGARSRAKYTNKNTARTRGEYMSNAAVSESLINSGVGKGLSMSKQKEIIANVMERSKASKVNAEMAAKEALINASRKDKFKNEREAYLASGIQAIPQTISNISAIKYKDQLVNMFGKDYGWFMKDGKPVYTTKKKASKG